MAAVLEPGPRQRRDVEHFGLLLATAPPRFENQGYPLQVAGLLVDSDQNECRSDRYAVRSTADPGGKLLSAVAGFTWPFLASFAAAKKSARNCCASTP